MHRRLLLDRLLVPVTAAFSTLCASAVLIDLWSAPDALVALAQA